MKKPNWLIATALIVAMSCTACSSPGSTNKSVKHNDSAVTSEDSHHHHKSSDKTKKSDTKDAASEKTKESAEEGKNL